jgi:catechol 2,3-dioxygenase-like lactoylglutathione lyase family enzyme
MHVSLRVRDIDAAVRFYEAFFGAPPHKRRPGYANFDLASPPLKLALTEEAYEKGGTLSHLGIQVSTEAEVSAVRDRLKECGLATFDEGDTVCCWARQDKVWATDPDGNEWEVYVLLDEMNTVPDTSFDARGIAKSTDYCCCAGDD